MNPPWADYWYTSELNRRAEQHVKWLKDAAAEALSRRWRERWENRKSHDHDSAMSEMVVRELLEGHGVLLRPGDTGKDGGPDFLAEGNGGRFAVEVTHVTDDAASDAIGIPNTIDSKVHYSRWPTDAIFEKINSKERQARLGNQPVMVCVTASHTRAYMFSERVTIEAILRGTERIVQRWDPTTGDTIGDVTLQGAFDTTPFTNTEGYASDGVRVLGAARKSISGVIAVGFGPRLSEVVARGALHPAAEHPFDPRWLSGIEFCGMEFLPQSSKARLVWYGSYSQSH